MMCWERAPTEIYGWITVRDGAGHWPPDACSALLAIAPTPNNCLWISLQITQFSSQQTKRN